MDVGQIAKEDPSGSNAPAVRWLWAAATGISLAFLILAAKACWTSHFWLYKSDFVSFWAAGRLTLEGQPKLAYDIWAHHAAEQAAGPVHGLVPFPYPPPFLAIVVGFATLPFGPAYFAWVGATAAIYLSAARRITQPVFAFALPPTFINLLSGQTGFLFGGIFVAGLSFVETAPWIAGAILGTMVLKPQLALLLPVAMLAGREWRVIGGAVLSASALLLVALICFGWSSYPAFFAILPHYVGFLRGAAWSWSDLISPFALARSVGASQPIALALHAVVALGAAGVTARAWWVRHDARLPILAASTLLASPYIFTYDALLIIVPIAWLIRAGRPWIVGTVWLMCLCPVLNYLMPLAWPNLVSPAALICLFYLQRQPQSARSAADASQVRPTHANPAVS